jgi:hypothetical protein
MCLCRAAEAVAGVLKWGKNKAILMFGDDDNDGEDDEDDRQNDNTQTTASCPKSTAAQQLPHACFLGESMNEAALPCVSVTSVSQDLGSMPRGKIAWLHETDRSDQIMMIVGKRL